MTAEQQAAARLETFVAFARENGDEDVTPKKVLASVGLLSFAKFACLDPACGEIHAKPFILGAN